MLGPVSERGFNDAAAISSSVVIAERFSWLAVLQPADVRVAKVRAAIGLRG
jgi:hypothetical protein